MRWSLARGPRLKAVLEAILGDVGDRWASRRTSYATASCPDCLRSWDNRHLHSLLDWRLALDVAELAYGRRSPSNVGWARAAVSRASSSRHTEGLSRCGLRNAGPLVTLQTSGKAAVIGHPLWRRDEPFWNEAQAEGAQVLRAKGLHVGMSDARQLRNRPESLYRMLKRQPVSRSPRSRPHAPEPPRIQMP